MTARRLIVGITVVVVSIWTMGLKCAQESEEAVTVTDLCLSSSDIDWTFTYSTCPTYLPSDLSSPPGGINGQADVYNDRGMQEYVYQEMTNGAKVLMVYAMDFQDAAKAQDIFQYWKDNQAALPEIDLTGWDNSSAYLVSFGPAQKLYAKIGKFYFELGFENLQDDNEAKTLAELLLDIYQREIG